MVDRGRIFVVEALRGLAALAVAWFHLTNGYKDGWVAATGAYGWLGVEVFFVLSGFVIPYSIAKTFPTYTWKDFPRFVLRRLLRLEPPYVISILLVLLLWQASALAPGFQGQQPKYEIGQVAAHLFYLVPWTDYSWLQPVYWTLAYEFAFYLAIGLLFPLIMNRQRLIAWLFIVTACVVAALLGYLPLICLMFLVGIAIFRLLQAVEIDFYSIAEATLVIGAVSLELIWIGAAIYAVVGIVIALLIIFCRNVSADRTIGGALLTALGTISYSFYLIHVPVGGRVINLGGRFVAGAWSEFALSLLALVVCLACSWVFYWSIERTAINFARRQTALVFRKQPGTTPNPAVTD
jgi:peptidoglycan/LPS O-acetylase OafA/YrhL